MERLSFRALRPKAVHSEFLLCFTTEQRIAALMSHSLIKIVSSKTRIMPIRTVSKYSRERDHPVRATMADTEPIWAFAAGAACPETRFDPCTAISRGSYDVIWALQHGTRARHSTNSCLSINIPHLLPPDTQSTHLLSRKLYNTITNAFDQAPYSSSSLPAPIQPSTNRNHDRLDQEEIQ